jgi:hypothetical protein
MARGDVLLGLDRRDEARAAYTEARALAGAEPGAPNLATLEQKLQSLNPVPGAPISAADTQADPVAGDLPAGEG